MDQVIETSTSVRRLNAVLFGAFGLLGLVLVAVGVYGVMAYSVTQRHKELGVRMALGASRNQVLGLILRQGMRLSLLGVGLGLVGAFAMTRVMGGVLFGVGATDPSTFATIPILLAGVALAACYLPARRATRADPIAALRSE